VHPTPENTLTRAAVCAGLLFAVGALVAGAPPGARQADKPVEQVRKNIQVIKGLPDSQILPLMNFVSTSLGVRCDHCHVIREKAGGERDWLMELDDKPTKLTARRMMRMVLALNKEHGADFRGAAVTCFTCHRGQTRPASFPALPLAASAHEGEAAAAAPSPAPLPSVAQVFERYVEAVGGREAASRLKTRVMKGTREASQGRVWPMEVTTREPGQFVMAVRIPEQGTFTQALDGAGGWVSNPRATRALSASELSDVRRVSRLLDTFKLDGPSPSMRVAGREKVGDRETVVVEDGPAPAVRERLFFDAETGLLLRRQDFADAVLFPIPEQTDFEDYREVDGVRLPFRIRTSNVDTWFSVTRRFTEIRHNVPVEDSAFRMPAAPRD
jgi:hypothetical protein